ncbi:Polyribonucleotide nucleotidyltransferase [Aphelenchoides fujianensis]|nr:Polyribonucleotide nucleotidyltransferase [Aphelenchoides fujianensis]
MLRRCLPRPPALQRCPYSTVFEKWTSGTKKEVVDVSTGQLEFTTGHMARFCSGTATATIGDSTVLGTVVNRVDEDPSLRMVVEFFQPTSSIARIPSNLLRAEFMQTDADIVRSRMIDRSIRPLINKQYPSTVNVVCRPLVADRESDLHVLGLNAAAAALALSSVPLISNFAACRVAIIDGQIVLNPPHDRLEHSSLNLIFSGTKEKRLMMIEMDGSGVSLDAFMDCVHRGLEEIHTIIDGIERLQRTAGKQKIYATSSNNRPAEVMEKVLAAGGSQIEYILKDTTLDKQARDNALNALKKRLYKQHLQSSYSNSQFNAGFYMALKQTVRDLCRKEGLRPDGRMFPEIRPIEATVDVFRPLHGSSLFQRGQSQVLSTVTLDFHEAAQLPEAVAKQLGLQQPQSFSAYYEFPAFAVNGIDESASRMQRRSVGHAVRALRRVMPDRFDFNVRLDCQVLESNGSTSMASVAGGSLALLDAGVPLKAPAVGIAMGLYHPEGEVVKKDGQSPIILTDLMGLEDYVGDLDLKIAGTSSGFIGMQLDVAIPGLPVDLLRSCLEDGRKGLNHVLQIVNGVTATPRSPLKPTVPLAEVVKLSKLEQLAIFHPQNRLIDGVLMKSGAKLYQQAGGVLIHAPTLVEMAAAKRMLEEATKRSGTSRAEDELVMREKFKWGAIFRGVRIEEVGGGELRLKLPGLQHPLTIVLQELSSQQAVDPSKLKVGQTIDVQYSRKDETLNLHRFTLLSA